MAKEEKEKTFEENLENLEKIVKDLESGNIPLDDAIEKFTEAMKLAKLCDNKLKNAEEKLNSLIAEYRSLKTEEEKKGFDEKMRHTLSEISPEERKKFRNAFLISARQTLAKAKELKEEAEIKLLLNGVDNYLSLSQIAQDYFGKSRSWLYQRINGAIVNGKPAQFTPEERQQLSNALLAISERIKDTALKLKVG